MNVSMPEVNAKYQTVNTVFVSVFTNWGLLLPANPMRYFLRVQQMTGGAGVLFVAPGPANFMATIPTVSNLPIVSKWSEEVTDTAGEWYAYKIIAGTWLITEVLQLP